METVREQQLTPLRVAGIRMQGRYQDCGKVFARLGRRVGRFASGKPLCRFYSDYQPQTADFEPCLPIRKLSDEQCQVLRESGIDVRELPGGPSVSLLHRGPYETLGTSYYRLHEQHLNEARQWPSREIYLKGPGMFFKGNPRKYVTEIQLPIAPDPDPLSAPPRDTEARRNQASPTVSRPCVWR